MQGTGLGTSLMLFAVGAVLAFAVNVQTNGIDLNTVGVILMVVGLIGLLMSLMFLGELDWFGARRGTSYDHAHQGVPSTVTQVTHEREVVREVDPPTSETTVTRTTRRL
jgi:sulfite exporter TauE/SafE